MTETALVHVEVRRENGGYAAYSRDVFGLNLWADSIDTLCDRIRDGLRLLYRMNHNTEVEVTLARAPDFAIPPFQPGSITPFVVARAA